MKVLVLGAGKGLGKVLVSMLAKRGDTVVAGIHNLKNSEQREDHVLYLQMDVTKQEELDLARKEIEEKIGNLDAVIDVAGVLMDSDRNESIMDISVSVLEKSMDVNAYGLVRAFRTLYPIMKNHSRFFAVTSEGGSFAGGGGWIPAYCASKTAANKFVQIIRDTLEHDGEDKVELIAVHPGRMNTEMGRTTAQIEPEEAAEGFCRLLDKEIEVNSKEHWFIDYKGNPMPL